MRTPLEIVQTRAETNASTRQCGDCTACCVLPRISPTEEPEAFPEGKPGYTKCRHLKSNGEVGCSIYNQRPQLCRDYMCLWRFGVLNGDERRRPDNIGIMFTMDTLENHIVFEAWELWEGAASQESIQYLLKQMAETMEMTIRFYGVPASINLDHPQRAELGKLLSEASHKDPQAVAYWCMQQVKAGRLALPADSSVLQDITMLADGIPIQRHYSPK